MRRSKAVRAGNAVIICVTVSLCDGWYRRKYTDPHIEHYARFEHVERRRRGRRDPASQATARRRLVRMKRGGLAVQIYGQAALEDFVDRELE
jgi:hypothetical protein